MCLRYIRTACPVFLSRRSLLFDIFPFHALQGIPSKYISVIRREQHHSECSIFEGFMDYLSFLTMKKRGYAYGRLSEDQDFIILNSVTNLPKAIPLLEGYDHIYSFLDNDHAGRETHAKLVEGYGYNVVRLSEDFDDFKDVNDFLCWIESKHE